jgi:hypothetical protein
MPQQFNPKTFVVRDSLGLDTIWLDVDALPAKTFNPVDTPELVLFHVDSAIAHQVNWANVDTFALHRMERRDTVLEKSFLNTTYHTPGKDGTPELSSQPGRQLVLSATVLLILFVSLSVIFTTSKNRIVRYFLSLFNKRKFKEYFVEENPRLLPTMPLMYLLQSMLVGSVVSVWLMSQMQVSGSWQFVGITLIVMLVYALLPLLRNGLIMLLGNVFMIEQDARKHVFISYLSHTLLFMLVIPLALQLAINIPVLNPYFNMALYTCFGLAMAYQLVKLIQNTPLPDIGALLYIFLYFCTLEILPLFLIYKMVSIYA